MSTVCVVALQGLSQPCLGIRGDVLPIKEMFRHGTAAQPFSRFLPLCLFCGGGHMPFIFLPCNCLPSWLPQNSLPPSLSSPPRLLQPLVAAIQQEGQCIKPRLNCRLVQPSPAGEPHFCGQDKWASCRIPLFHPSHLCERELFSLGLKRSTPKNRNSKLQRGLLNARGGFSSSGGFSFPANRSGREEKGNAHVWLPSRAAHQPRCPTSRQRRLDELTHCARGGRKNPIIYICMDTNT